MKEKLVDTFEEKLPPVSELECGYLEKRTNAKRWIEDDQDVEAMYNALSSTDEITLWCQGRPPEKTGGEKRKGTESMDADKGPSSKRTHHEEQVDSVTQELCKLHNDRYTGPQLRLWARMKVHGQHDSMSEPPPIPLFTGNVPSKRTRHEPLTEALTSAATAVVGLLTTKNTPSNSAATMSPAKRAHVSGQYLEHLEKLKNLHESGVLNDEEFKEQKSFALKNIRQLNN